MNIGDTVPKPLTSDGYVGNLGRIVSLLVVGELMMTDNVFLKVCLFVCSLTAHRHQLGH